MPTKVSNQVLKDTYTSSEQDSGQVWVDGRIIYRKVISGTLNVIANNMAIASGISGLSNSSALLSIGGYLRLGNSTNASPSTQVLPVFRESGNFFALRGLNTSNGDIDAYSTFAWGNSYYTIIMEYVK